MQIPGAGPRSAWDVSYTLHSDKRSCHSVTSDMPGQPQAWRESRTPGARCQSHSLHAVRNRALAALLQSRKGEFPDERDVARREGELRAFNSGLERMGLSPVRPIAERLENYRATPKHYYYLSTADQLVDAANRYWIATQRDTHEWSYLDVYDNAEYVGSVKVRDRLRAIDLHWVDSGRSGRPAGKLRDELGLGVCAAERFWPALWGQ